MLKYKALSFVICTALSGAAQAENFPILKQITAQPGLLSEGAYQGHYYVPSTLDTIR